MNAGSFAPLLIALGVTVTSVQAQGNAQQQLDQERSRIAAERQAADSRYAQAEAACYARFAVNDCVNAAKAARRETLADLRRQEVSLNDDERRRKGAAQRQRLDERSSAENQQRAAQQRAQALQEAALREERGARKAAAAALPASAVAPPAVVAVPAPAPPAPDAVAIERRNKKLEEAKARKERLQRRQLERTKPLAKPLPVPAS
jgi:hypothetical protein